MMNADQPGQAAAEVGRTMTGKPREWTQRFLYNREKNRTMNERDERSRNVELLRKVREEQTRRKQQATAFNLSEAKLAQLGLGPGHGMGRGKGQVCPRMLAMFNNDESEFWDFMESLNDNELRIILQNPDNPKVILKLKNHVLDDVENTCKALEIDG
jgi:hypothetical protein